MADTSPTTMTIGKNHLHNSKTEPENHLRCPPGSDNGSVDKWTRCTGADLGSLDSVSGHRKSPDSDEKNARQADVNTLDICDRGGGESHNSVVCKAICQPSRPNEGHSGIQRTIVSTLADSGKLNPLHNSIAKSSRKSSTDTVSNTPASTLHHMCTSVYTLQHNIVSSCSSARRHNSVSHSTANCTPKGKMAFQPTCQIQVPNATTDTGLAISDTGQNNNFSTPGEPKSQQQNLPGGIPKQVSSTTSPSDESVFIFPSQQWSTNCQHDIDPQSITEETPLLSPDHLIPGKNSEVLSCSNSPSNRERKGLANLQRDTKNDLVTNVKTPNKTNRKHLFLSYSSSSGNRSRKYFSKEDKNDTVFSSSPKIKTCKTVSTQPETKTRKLEGQGRASRKDTHLSTGSCLSVQENDEGCRPRAGSDSMVSRSKLRAGVHLHLPGRFYKRGKSQEPAGVTENEGSPSPACGSPLFSQNSLGDKEVSLMLARLGYVEEEEKEYVVGVHVRGASIDKLAAIVVDCMGPDGSLGEKEAFLRVLFLMHQWFCTSEFLADKFLDLYKSCDNQICCAVALCKHQLSCRDCAKRQYKARICYSVRYWIETFPMHFDCSRRLSQSVHRLQELIWQEDPQSELATLIDISKVPSYEWMRNMSVRAPNKLHSTSKKVSLVFNNIRPAELAEQLTFLEFKAFRRITFVDLKNYAVSASLKENPKLERSISLFNGLSQWVQCMVLYKTTPQQRATVILKFINVAKRLRELQNFNTLMAVVGGLTHSSLARLTKTHSCINHDYHKVLMEMTELLSSSNNFSNYRRALQTTEGFRIPILGVHLKDMILLNTALPDKLHPNLVNFRKMAQLSNIFRELMMVQLSSVPVEGNMDLVNMIKLSLDLHYTEDDIYELSLAREPRSSLSAPSTPTKPVVFADWIAGVSPPDPETINKHVYDMVEAVFKNYDHDRDGFISHEEFEAIAGNFPFIDSFCVLDADKDGMISKAEMKTYFNRANCHALRKCFKHNFHETTYFKPTFCIHCTGLLWGLIKQGWKCKDCGINAHKHCKDLVVMECRSKAHAAVHGRSNSVPGTFNGASGSHDVTLARKRKMSARHKRSRQAASTQTDESGVLSATNSPRLSGCHADSGATSNSSPRLSGSFDSNTSTAQDGSQDSTQESTQGSSHSSQMAACCGGPTDFYEEQSTLYERLVKAEEVRESLQREKQVLVERVEKQNVQIGSLNRQIGLIRQHTISFILDQMDTLNIQRDTQV